jgi:hypothetical protein
MRTKVIRASLNSSVPTIIEYRRGKVTILDLAGLEHASCECYSAVEKHFVGILPSIVEGRRKRQSASSAIH